ncbi:MAG TPA: hypothetical protein VJI33_00335 [Candidatus Paceibacterota bacterium]
MINEQIGDTKRYLRSFLYCGREDQAVRIFKRCFTDYLGLTIPTPDGRPLNPDLQLMANLAIELFGNEAGAQIVEDCCVEFGRTHLAVLISLKISEISTSSSGDEF